MTLLHPMSVMTTAPNKYYLNCRSRFQRHYTLASARVPRPKTPNQVGDRVWHAFNARHGGRIHTVLGAPVHHGTVRIPFVLGYFDRSLVVYPHLREQGLLGHAQCVGKFQDISLPM